MTTLETLRAKTESGELWTKEDWQAWAQHLGVEEPSTANLLNHISDCIQRSITVKTSRQKIEAAVAEAERVRNFAYRMARIDGMGMDCYPRLHTPDGELVEEWADAESYDELFLTANPEL